jgi:hypothetical protein
LTHFCKITETDMHELGRLEDLPESYRADLTARNLVPLWPSLRAVLPPGKPTSRTAAHQLVVCRHPPAASEGR